MPAKHAKGREKKEPLVRHPHVDCAPRLFDRREILAFPFALSAGDSSGINLIAIGRVRRTPSAALPSTRKRTNSPALSPWLSASPLAFNLLPFGPDCSLENVIAGRVPTSSALPGVYVNLLKIRILWRFPPRYPGRLVREEHFGCSNLRIPGVPGHPLRRFSWSKRQTAPRGRGVCRWWAGDRT